jgi:hypothetical protein
VAVGCVLVSVVSAGCSPGSSGNAPAGTSIVMPPPTPSATVKDPSIPGIGATREDWDASHVQNPGFNNGAVYGYDPSLPDYLSANHAVYIGVGDNSDTGMIPRTGNRIQVYILNMHAVDRDEAQARVRQELPSDATVAWDLKLDQCYRVAFNSKTMEAAMQANMVVVQLQELQKGGKLAFNPHTFNQANFLLNVAGPPDPEIDC